MSFFRRFIALVSIVIMFFFIWPSHEIKGVAQGSTIDFSQGRDTRYSHVLSTWKDAGYQSITGVNDIYLSHVFSSEENDVIPVSEAEGFDHDVLQFDSGSFSVFVNVTVTGLYEIGFHYYSKTDTILPIAMKLEIDDEQPFNEAGGITLETYWRDTTESFNLDRYGNEVLPRQEQWAKWTDISLRDAGRYQREPLLFLLEAGVRELTFTLETGQMLVGAVTIKSPVVTPSYATYLSDHQHSSLSSSLIKHGAQQIAYKNTAEVRPSAARDAGLNPFGLVNLRINIVDGLTFNEAGQRVVYQVNVEDSGLYHLSFKVKQDVNANSPSFRRLLVNGEVPFEEAKSISFPYTTKWKNVTLKADTGEAYKFYLHKGQNEIALEVDASKYYPIYESIQDMIVDISALTLEVKQLTGNNADRNRDWDLKAFIPDVEDRLVLWRDTLLTHADTLKSIHQTRRRSRDIVYIESAIDNLNRLLSDIDRLPYRLNILSEGSGSVSQLLGDASALMLEQPLSLDMLYIHGDVSLPRSQPNVFVRIWISIQRFVLSFFHSPYTDSVSEGEVSIWVNRPRQFVDVMQDMADSQFTAESGISVKFSLMPDESKLILANVANAGPDMAMGTHVNLAYNLALRGVIHDLMLFDDVDEMLALYRHEGAIIPFVHDGGIYGLPETQNFNILFYRKDIFQALNLNVPDTWDDVLGMLPELQRFGMNFFVPLAYLNAYKTVDTTVPFIYQFDGRLYHDDGLTTAIDEANGLAAMQFMTDLFTIYGLPLQVASFYHEFRYGTIPVGIGDFGVYVQLMHAAPEIKNMWGIAPVPGIENDVGQVNRTTTGPGHGMMIMEQSTMKDEAWEFMKWWMRTDTQVAFEQTVVTTLGSEYMWNSANLDAFDVSSWPREHKDVLFEQWEHLMNVPNSPASYMIERELSNAWNRVVMSGDSVRDSVDHAVRAINREMTRKNFEFGYTDRFGNKLRPYQIATLDMIRGLVIDHEG